MRRGFSLVEILVALVIMVVVSSSVLMVFQYQSRNAGTQRAIAEMNLMAKGTSEELTRTLRMAGGMLPPGNGGVKVWGAGAERVTVVLNRSGTVDTTREPSVFVFGTLGVGAQSFANPLILPVRNVAGFTDKGYVLTTVRTPPTTFPVGTTPAPVRDTMIVLPVLALFKSVSVAGLATGAVIVADGSYFASKWKWMNSVRTDVNVFVYGIDSVRYRLMGDTLLRRVNRNDSASYALGIDSLRLQYQHPNGNWYDSLWSAVPSGQVEKVRISLKVRTRKKDNALAKTSPPTKGYHYQVIVNEVALRNVETLVNQ
ncbi:MAG: prepilin-type N-terminal cleavage/methylation domain-containing protein [Fibrobacterota bacterium]|nr:MAG: prepilin-type N-terminal cleavage/methylation domain-containing protein [Fibrobacterota bacterium]